MTAQPRPRRTIRFRGRSFLAMVLAPEPPLADWLAQIDDLAARSAGFFVGRAVVLDMMGVAFDLRHWTWLLDELSARGIRIMAIESRETLGPDFPPAISGGRDLAPVESDRATQPAAPAPRPRETLIIDQPVRSGQTVIHPDGDIIIVGALGSGAEVIAGGSIHVYGTLRGRAIAGTTGEARARIFCRKLEAELLAIDGYYLTEDGMDPHLRGRAAQVWLDGDAIMMAPLD